MPGSARNTAMSAQQDLRWVVHSVRVPPAARTSRVKAPGEQTCSVYASIEPICFQRCAETKFHRGASKTCFSPIPHRLLKLRDHRELAMRARQESHLNWSSIEQFLGLQLAASPIEPAPTY